MYCMHNLEMIKPWEILLRLEIVKQICKLKISIEKKILVSKFVVSQVPIWEPVFE